MLVNGGNAAAWTADDGSFALNIRAAGYDGERRAYAWSIYTDGALLAESDAAGMIHGPAWNRSADALGALGTMLSFLGHDADGYRRLMGAGEPEDGFSFGPMVAEWAYMASEELELAALEVEAAIEA